MENTKTITATDKKSVNLLLFKGNLKPNSSIIGGIKIKNHNGNLDLSDVKVGISTPDITNTVAVKNLNSSGTNKHSKAEKDIALTLKS